MLEVNFDGTTIGCNTPEEAVDLIYDNCQKLLMNLCVEFLNGSEPEVTVKGYTLYAGEVLFDTYRNAFMEVFLPWFRNYRETMEKQIAELEEEGTCFFSSVRGGWALVKRR